MMKMFRVFAKERQYGMYGERRNGYLVFVEELGLSIETDRLDEAIQTMERYIGYGYHEVRVHEYVSGDTWYCEPKWLAEQRGEDFVPVF